MIIEIWTLTVEDDHSIHTSLHHDQDEIHRTLQAKYDPDHKWDLGDYQVYIDQLGLVIYTELHQYEV